MIDQDQCLFKAKSVDARTETTEEEQREAAGEVFIFLNYT